MTLMMITATITINSMAETEAAALRAARFGVEEGMAAEARIAEEMARERELIEALEAEVVTLFSGLGRLKWLSSL